MDAVATVLAQPFGGGARVDAAVRAACSFHFWRSLSGLGDTEAAALGAGLVELAAR
jgi:hypothetical protein